MFGIFTGTIINAILIVAGTTIGLLFKTPRLTQIGDRVFQAFGLFILAMGIAGASDMSQIYLILASIIIGTAIGEIIDLDKKFTAAGNFLEEKFSKKEGESTFAKGFIQASLLFCVGSLAVVGSLQSGINNDPSMLITKGIMDGITAITLTMGFGVGVGFSILPILIYQGALTLLAGWISPIMSPEILAVSSTVGNLFLVGIGLNMLKITNLKVANFLPAMFIPMVYQALLLLVR